MFSKSRAATVSVFLYLLTSGLLHLVAPTTVRSCRLLSCQREERLVSYGYDALKEAVQIDVGMCSEVYEDSVDCDMPDVNRVTQPQEGSGGDIDIEQCQRKCEPRSYERISSSNRESPFTVKVIKSCYRTRHHCLKACVRKPNYVYMFPGSKYQQRIDVGKCVGQCVENPNSTLGCVTSRSKSIAVEGPNGYETMQVIEECSCKNRLCYRVDHYQSFSEIVVEQSNNTTTQKKRREKLINVGKCIGSCPGVKIPGTCYPSDDNCVFYLGERNAYCVPTAGQKHTYTDLDGNEQTVAAILECGCSTG